MPVILEKNEIDFGPNHLHTSLKADLSQDINFAFAIKEVLNDYAHILLSFNNKISTGS